MNPLLELVRSVLRSYPGIFSNIMVDIIYLVVVGLVASQYSRIQRIEEKLYGIAENKAFYQTLTAIYLGLLGGLFASVLLVVVGVSVTDSGIAYLMPIAVLLYLFSPRFMCYAYAGSLAGLSYLLFGWPQVNIPAVMALVACLHAVEALLIRLSGHTCATPVYVAHEKREVVGGFTLQRFWPIPIIVLYMIKVPDLSQMSGLIHLPDWWPLISAPEIAGAGESVFAMMPIVAALGYGDIAIASNPKDKAKSTASNLMWFSVALLILSIGASRWPSLSWLALIFSPVGHEIVIKAGLNEEFGKNPKYTPTEKGVLLLDVVGGSLAKKAGFRSGNVICYVNDVKISDRHKLEYVVANAPGPISVWVLPTRNEIKLTKIEIERENNEDLGFIPVPQPDDKPVAGAFSDGILLKFLKNLVKSNNIQE